MTIFNALKTIFIYLKFKFLPFDIGYVKILVTVLFIYLTIALLPNFSNNFLNLIIKCFSFFIISFLIIFKLGLIYELTNLVNKKLKNL